MFTIFECLRPGLHLAIFVREKEEGWGCGAERRSFWLFILSSYRNKTALLDSFLNDLIIYGTKILFKGWQFARIYEKSDPKCRPEISKFSKNAPSSRTLDKWRVRRAALNGTFLGPENPFKGLLIFSLTIIRVRGSKVGRHNYPSARNPSSTALRALSLQRSLIFLSWLSRSPGTTHVHRFYGNEFWNFRRVCSKYLSPTLHSPGCSVSYFFAMQTEWRNVGVLERA